MGNLFFVVLRKIPLFPLFIVATNVFFCCIMTAAPPDLRRDFGVLSVGTAIVRLSCGRLVPPSSRIYTKAYFAELQQLLLELALIEQQLADADGEAR